MKDLLLDGGAITVATVANAATAAAKSDGKHLHHSQLDLNDGSLPFHCWTNKWQPLKIIINNGQMTMIDPSTKFNV